ncbi:hypothetical protein [Microbacterium sp. PMB16]|uniref:hypothetical protein n=1 Tax=Microbacterium sp. PMB16 TaxID=3120157 RepID=UPI003F4C7F65
MASVFIAGPVEESWETRTGERVSLYLSAPGTADGADDGSLRAAMDAADAIVLDLAAEPLRLLPMARATGIPIWVDVHDYDGAAEFHRPFLAAADAVFCNADRLGDPVAFLRFCVDAGASLAVCTLGADVLAALAAGARSAATVLRSRHLHPLLDDVLPPAP